MDWLSDLLDKAPGFGGCGDCLYRTSGSALLCYTCARRTMEPLKPVKERCQVCDQPFAPGAHLCGNWLCDSEDRQFQWNYAVAMRSGQLEAAINRYKYQDRRGWKLIFGRVLAGFLEERPLSFEGFDLITASPTYVGEGGRSFDHTRLVLEQAALEVTPGQFDWPFDTADEPAIIRTAPSRSLAGKTVSERREIARTEIAPSLWVPEPARTAGRSILVYDDVFTDGTTLNEIARALRTQGGALEVCGISLCRQPWRGGP